MNHNLKPNKPYDVVVIGGGPAGSTTATILADKGYRVLVLEKTKFPRFSIGESLIPETYWPLKRIGMLEKLKASHFPVKYSVQFISHSGKESQPFYFFNANPHESAVTWQVLRSEFDQMMLENAEEHGAEVREETLVKEVLFDGDQAVGVLAGPTGGTGADQEIRARVVVDASGRLAFLARRLHIRQPDPSLDKIAVFAHYENGALAPGIDGGATLVIYIRENLGWFWYIPLPNNVVSVGVVASPHVLYQGRTRDPQRILEEEIELSIGMKTRLAEARRISEVRVLSDYSSRSLQSAGNGWVLVGDALGFLDPIYSSGVLLAMTSSESAAEKIDEALQANDLSGRRLGRFGPRYASGIEAFRKLVYAFYTQTFNFGTFVRKHPEHTNSLIKLLSGDVYKDENYALFPDMAKYCDLPEPIPLAVPGSSEPVSAS
jgi:flavin-dependent dehydrogenase